MNYEFCGTSSVSSFIRCPQCGKIHRIVLYPEYKDLLADLQNENMLQNIYQIPNTKEYICNCGFKSDTFSVQQYKKSKEDIQTISDRGNEKALKIATLVAAVIFLFFTIFSKISSNFGVPMFMGMFLLPVIVFVCIYNALADPQKKKVSRLKEQMDSVYLEALKQEQDEAKEQIKDIYDSLNLPSIPRTADIIQSVTIPVGTYYIWKNEDDICFHPPIVLCPEDAAIYLLSSQMKKYSIKIQDIDFYSTHGEMYREQKISGGGSNITGAIIGGVLAGDAGAIIGSRNKIVSETVTHDTRIVHLYYFESGIKKDIALSLDALEIFKELIPEKSEEFILPLKAKQSISNNVNEVQLDAVTKLRQLSELKEEGILTEEEYLTKKKQLLDRI